MTPAAFAARFGYGPALPERAQHLDPDDCLPPPAERAPDGAPAGEAMVWCLRGLAANAAVFGGNDREAFVRVIHGFYAEVFTRYREAAARRLRFTIASPWPVYERLVYFWTNHFALTTFDKLAYLPVAEGFEHEAIRPHVGGRFADMLRAAALHPAMLMALDQHYSIGPNSVRGLIGGHGLNENLAREVMELHTLGVGNYTQADVRQMAELLTGLRVDQATGEPYFAALFAEPGPETVLGHAYGGVWPGLGAIHAALDDLAAHPATARHVCGKLARHFVADRPPEPLVVRMAAEWVATGGNLPAVYRVLMTAPEAAALAGAKVRAPMEFVISALRAMGLAGMGGETRPADMRELPGMTVSTVAQLMEQSVRTDDLFQDALAAMGQPLWKAPSPAGWPDGNADWLGPTAIAHRLAWAERAVALVPERARDEAAGRAVDGLAGAATQAVLDAAASPRDRLVLALMSPEFNRR